MPPPRKRPFSKRAAKSRRDLTNRGFTQRRKAKPNAIVGVAEGDSWFDFAPAWLSDIRRGDLLGHLCFGGRYNIYRVSKAGDTLENMVYGTKYRRKKKIYVAEIPTSLEKTIAAVKKHKPRIFLFSGGGNDIAGTELEAYLNHKDSGLPAIRKDYMEYVIGTASRKACEHIITEVKKAAPGVHIFLHGYGYAIPDGRGVFQANNGWSFVGPWLKPALFKKRYVSPLEQRKILKTLIDRMNTMMAGLQKADKNKQVHYIDLRKIIGDKDWADELHLKTKGWAKVAKVFDARIRKELGL